MVLIAHSSDWLNQIEETMTVPTMGKFTKMPDTAGKDWANAMAIKNKTNVQQPRRKMDRRLDLFFAVVAFEGKYLNNT